MTNAPLPYQPFDAALTAPVSRFVAGSVDTHMHVFGPQTRYAYTQNRTYTPTDASLEAYRHMTNTLGIDRTVVVQPSVYGTDNSATRDAVVALGAKCGRGVAVVDAAVSDDELDALHADGFRGVRMNLLFKGGVDFDAVKTLAKRLADRNWHIQFLVDVSNFEGVYERLSALPTDVVIDHMGHAPAKLGTAHAGFQDMLRLLDTGRCWVKLSGPYRFTAQATAPYDDVTPIAQALVAANPERLVWGSDWPHPYIAVPMPNDGALADMLPTWVPNAATRHKILVENPEKLYGFERFE